MRHKHQLLLPCLLASRGACFSCLGTQNVSPFSRPNKEHMWSKSWKAGSRPRACLHVCPGGLSDQSVGACGQCSFLVFWLNGVGFLHNGSLDLDNGHCNEHRCLVDGAPHTKDSYAFNAISESWCLPGAGHGAILWIWSSCCIITQTSTVVTSNKQIASWANIMWGSAVGGGGG